MEPALAMDHNDPNLNHTYHQSSLNHPALSSTSSVAAANLQHNNFTIGGNMTFHIGANMPHQQVAGESPALTLQGIRTLADWLSPLNYHQFQKDMFEKVTKGTGSWIFQHEEFDQWLNGRIKTLWGVGIPGAGKTCLISFIINHLVNNKQARVIYIYCQYKDSLTADKILSCLLKQLVEHSNHIASYVWSSLYEKCLHTATQPSRSELLRTLKGAMSSISNIFLVVDALDELKDEVCSDLIPQLLSLQLPLLMTSRTHVKVAGISQPNLTILAPSEDFHKFVSQKLKSMTWLESFLQDPILRNNIIEEICKKCNGMFLLAALQLDTLASGDIINIPALRQAISKLPTSLNQQYKLILERILAQNQAQRDLACKAIQLVMHSTRTLQVRELLEALTVDLSTASINQENCTTTETLLRVSFGLLVIVHTQKDTEVQMQASVNPDLGNREIKLIHYSAQACLEAQHFLPPNSHTFIADISAAYLICTSDKCQVTTLTSISNLEESEILSMHPFLLYACLNIGYHTFKAIEKNVGILPEQVKQLWQRQLTMPLPLASLGSYLDHIQAVHFAALYGLDTLFQERWPVSVVAQSILGCSPLFYACLGGQTPIVKQILGSLAARAEISKPTTFGATVLHAAFRAGEISLVEMLLPMASTSTKGQQHFLLGHSKIDVNAKMLDGQTALHIASKYGHATIIKKLLRLLGSGINASQTSSELRCNHLLWGYRGAFYLNQKYNNLKSLINAQDTGQWTAVHYAAQNGHQKAMQTLLGCPGIDIRVKTKNGQTPLHLAAQNGHHVVVQLLLGSPDIQINVTGQDGLAPLHLAALNDHHAVIQILLAFPSIQINLASQHGMTPLHLASYNDNQTAVQLLLASPGIQVNAVAQHGLTPLHLASLNGNQAVVQLLLAFGSDTNLANKDGQTPLHLAAQRNHLGVIQLLLASPSIWINVADADGLTPLHLASSNGSQAIVQLLLTSPSIQVNVAAVDGFMPLHIASQEGYHAVVQLLLASPGIQINAAALAGITPLHLASHVGNQAIVQLLLASPGIQINPEGMDKWTPLHLAAGEGHQTVVQVLLASPGIWVDAAGQNGSTPLHLAALNGHQAVVQLLLAFPGIQVNAATQSMLTPLHLAVFSGHQAVVQLLLASPGINAKAENHHKSTPLHLAAEHGHHVIVQLLLNSPYDMDINAKDGDGGTVVDCAVLGGHEDIAQLLRSYGSDNSAAEGKRGHAETGGGHEGGVEMGVECGREVEEARECNSTAEDVTE